MNKIENKIIKFFKKFSSIGILFFMFLTIIEYTRFKETIDSFSLGIFFDITFCLGLFGLLALYYEYKFINVKNE